MGTVGVNGKIKFENSERGCLLYMKFDDEYYIDSYNDGYCVFPIIGAAITSILALAFLAYWAMVMRRREESVPRYISIALMAVSGVMALFSFAICGEIGIGLKGRHLCDMATSISALYDAQVSAGLMGGCWLAVLILEWFQFKSRFPNSVGHIGKKPRI